MRNDLTDIRFFMFETAWGWCGAQVGPLGVIALKLPLADFDKALRSGKNHFLTGVNAADIFSTPKFHSRWGGDAIAAKLGNEWAGKLASQVREYFRGRRREFDLKLDWTGVSSFRKKVWKELLKVPFGRTSTYGDLARRTGRPNAARPVGGAVGANPVPLIVPCHRILASDGGLSGFSAEGGVKMKKRLLEFEREILIGVRG